MNDDTVPLAVLQAFDASSSVVPLRNGEGRSYRVGNLVVRREQNVLEARQLAELLNGIEQVGFRVPRPIRAKDGDWIAAGEWSAWTYVEGRIATNEDLPRVIPAIVAFHQAIKPVARPDYLQRRVSLFDNADRAAWEGPLPEICDAGFASLAERLVSLRRPIDSLPSQLIHGDLNPSNMLIAPGEPPAIIDMTPYWRPAGFALAVAAFWFCVYCQDAESMRLFFCIPHMEQLLVRAALRMLLTHVTFVRDSRGDAEFSTYEASVAMVQSYVRISG